MITREDIQTKLDALEADYVKVQEALMGNQKSLLQLEGAIIILRQLLPVEETPADE